VFGEIIGALKPINPTEANCIVVTVVGILRISLDVSTLG
jgi:hypothetical protein